MVLIDDDDVDVMNVRRALEKAQFAHALFVASDGVAGLALLRGTTVPQARRLVLLDLHMPRMNGLEFLRTLRADPALASTAVVMMTTSTDERDRAEAYELGVSAFLVKPVSFAALVDLMTALSRYWVLAELPHVTPRLRLLIVDEDAACRRSIRQTIDQSPLDADVFERASSDGLGEAITSERPDCVLLDHMVPPETAHDVVPRLRAEGITVPILCIADHDDEIGADLVSLGATDFLAKRDLTPGRLARRVRYAIRLVEAERARARTERVCESVLAIVSHDLRGPLSAISVAVDALGDPSVAPDERQRYVDAVRRSIRRADRLIRDLLDTSVIEAGGLRLERTPGPVAPLLAQCARDHELLATQAGVALRVVVDDDTGDANLDRQRVVQALSNLVANALRHGQGTTEIRLRGRAAGADAVELVVEDDGPGITAVALPHIFDRFGHHGRSRRSGSGLGLAIVKGVADAHGGTITAEAGLTAGQGARFTMHLPRA